MYTYIYIYIHIYIYILFVQVARGFRASVPEHSPRRTAGTRGLGSVAVATAVLQGELGSRGYGLPTGPERGGAGGRGEGGRQANGCEMQMRFSFYWRSRAISQVPQGASLNRSGHPAQHHPSHRTRLTMVLALARRLLQCLSEGVLPATEVQALAAAAWEDGCLLDPLCAHAHIPPRQDGGGNNNVRPAEGILPNTFSPDAGVVQRYVF